MMKRFLSLIAIGLITIVLFTGCGKEAEETLEVEDFVEAIPEAEDEASAEESEVVESEAVKTEEKVETEKVDSVSGTTAVTELSEETIHELTKEALEEYGKDTQLVDGKIKTSGLTFDLPEGFEESEETKNLYVTRRYPLDASNIYYCEREADPVMQFMDQETYKALTEEHFKEANGVDMQFDISEFKEIKVDGIPGFRVQGTYKFNELTLTQIEYIINADKTYILVYTMTNEYDKMEAFMESEKTIHVKK